MGLKTLRAKYNIHHPLFHIEIGRACIGSGAISALCSIDLKTGEISHHPAFPEIREEYPELFSVPPEELKALLEAEDEFEAYLPVYAVKEGELVQYFCEELGFPNTTHCGKLMYQNRFSSDPLEVVEWARENAEAGISLKQDRNKQLQKELARNQEQTKLLKKELDLLKLAAKTAEHISKGATD